MLNVINMTVEGYDLIITEKNKIIENIYSELDLYKKRIDIIDNFMKILNIADFESLFMIIENYIKNIKYPDGYEDDSIHEETDYVDYIDEEISSENSYNHDLLINI